MTAVWGRATAGVVGGLAGAIVIGGVVANLVSDRENAVRIGGMIAVVTWAALIVFGVSRRSGATAWSQMAALALIAAVGLWWTA